MKVGVILHSFICSFANILIILSRRYQVHQNIFRPLTSPHLPPWRPRFGDFVLCGKLATTLANIPYKPKYFKLRYRLGADDEGWKVLGSTW